MIRNSSFVIAAIMLLLPLTVFGATVKPLEVVTEKILVLETQRLADDHAINAALVRRALERVDKQMNVMSQDRTRESLKLLRDARETVLLAEKSAEGLSCYVAEIKGLLAEKGHARFLPLAKLNDEVEKPYYKSLEKFLATATDFVQFCNDNLEAITSGQPAENKHYDEYYAAYLREMDSFNVQSMKRSQLLADWSADYPSLVELLPR